MSVGDRLIQIVPRLRRYDGVSDYALGLADALSAHHGTTSIFIEAGTQPGGAVPMSGELHRCPAGSVAGLAMALGRAGAAKPDARVLLHYVGYGYAKRGAPLWLVRSIRESRRVLRYRLGVVFHELYAGGRPWQSSFWLSGLQQILSRRLALECDGILLTREGNRNWLRLAGVLAGKRVEVLPAPSAVGEPASVERPGARDAALVVWGGGGVKRTVYGERWGDVQRFCAARGVVRIEDIGVPAQAYPRSPIELRVHGLLPTADVAAVLGRSRFGLAVYPQAFLAKSSVLAAYAVHGTVPVVLGEPCAEVMDGLVPDRHFLWLRASGTRDLDEVAGAMRDWYRGHTWAQHAGAVRALFEGVS